MGATIDAARESTEAGGNMGDVSEEAPMVVTAGTLAVFSCCGVECTVR